MKSRHDGIPEADGDIIADIYERSPQKVFNCPPKTAIPRTAQEFVGDLDWRIYTEWCMEGYPGATRKKDGRGWDERYKDYEQVDPYSQWINRETHFALERLMQKNPTAMTDELHRSTRIKVVQAAAKRAIELFASWGDPWSASPKEDQRNLRTSLKEYLEAAL
jgi:hypothetical protein